MPHKSFSRADLIATVLGMLVLVTAVFGQVDDRARELANRSTCAANLRGLTQSMNVYAADGDVYPFLPPSSATTYDVTFKPETGGRSPDLAIDALYKGKKYPNNPSANMWLMVLTGQVAAKQFICKTDPFATDSSTLTDKDGAYYLNFQDPKSFSYSSAFPWAEKDGKAVMAGLWKSDTDAGLAVICDMAPYLGRTAADNPSPSPDSANEQWVVKNANSANHFYDGQNVGYGDGHAEFTRTPAVGHNNDSIWGIRKNVPENKFLEQPISAGVLPHALGGMKGEWDVVMVPTRDGKGNLK